MKYKDLDNLSWDDIRDAVNVPYRPPYSVHIPINFPASKMLMFCDCALNAYFLPTPALNTSIEKDRKQCQLMRLKMTSLAFGEIPFVADFRQVTMSRKYGALPIIRGDFTAWNIVYHVDFFSTKDGVLHERVTVRNESGRKRTATVWLRPSMPLESKAFDYHYYPFNWDASRWLQDNSFSYCNGEIISECGVCGIVQPGEFSANWIESTAGGNGGVPAVGGSGGNGGVPAVGGSGGNGGVKNVNANFTWEAPYRVLPQFVLPTVERVLKLEIELEDDAPKSFEYTFGFDGSNDSALAVPFDDAEAQAVSDWNDCLKNMPNVDMGDVRENDVLNAVRLCNLQLLLQDDAGLRPCQGGSSERFYVWVWEAMCAVRSMLNLGHFEEVRKVIEFIFSLQDGGCPPVGKFVTTQGAVGTSGPKWANTTGAALILASEYIDISGDREFTEKYIDRLIRAGRWIIGEIRATRVPGNPNYGIMPEACASDGDYGQLVLTDAWSLAGLMRLRNTLLKLGYLDFMEFDIEVKLYREHFLKVLQRVARPDGFISRSFGDDSRVCHEFRFTDTPLDCCNAGVFSAHEPLMEAFLNWMDDNAFKWLFCSEVTHGIYYIGNNELAIMKMFLELGRWKSAWAAAQVFRKYAMTQDVFLTQERFSSADCSFTAWQPNGSNNGRFIELQLARFFHETEDAIILYGGFAPHELKHAPALHGVYTRYGKIDLFISNGRICLATQKHLPHELKIVTPHDMPIAIGSLTNVN